MGQGKLCKKTCIYLAKINHNGCKKWHRLAVLEPQHCRRKGTPRNQNTTSVSQVYLIKSLNSLGFSFHYQSKRMPVMLGAQTAADLLLVP